ncbi:hypothetical protein BH09BAC1_BH09BAC1_01650 [soil metagenome]
MGLSLALFTAMDGKAQGLDGAPDDTLVVATSQVDVSHLVLRAKSYYEIANYTSAITFLDSAVTLLNRTNFEIQYWLAKSNNALGRFKQARVDALKYLNLPDASVQLGYSEMMELKSSLDLKLGVEDTTHRDGSRLVGGGFTESETWEFARKTGNLQAFRNYLKFYPDGPHALEAKQAVEREEKLNQEPSKLLVEAVKRGDMNQVRDLLNRGADVNYAETFTRVFERAEGKSYEINFEMPLYVALMRMDYAMTKFLLENGADPNRFIYRKIYTYQSGGKTKTLLESMIVVTSQHGRYPNSDDRLIEFIDLLLEHGLDINFYNGSPISAAVYYHDAKKYKRTKLIRYLLRKGADPKLKGWNDGAASALDIAKGENDKRLLETLKEKRYKEIRKKIAKRQKEQLKKYRLEQKEQAKLQKEKDKQEKLNQANPASDNTASPAIDNVQP